MENVQEKALTKREKHGTEKTRDGKEAPKHGVRKGER